jgi:hypothetical protein
VVSGQRHTPAALPPETDRVPIAQEAGWAPGAVWTVSANVSLTGIRTRTVHPIASRYEKCLSCTLRMLQCECTYQCKFRPAIWPLQSTNRSRHELCICSVCLARQWASCVKGKEQRNIFSTSLSLLYTLILIISLPHPSSPSLAHVFRITLKKLRAEKAHLTEIEVSLLFKP